MRVQVLVHFHPQLAPSDAQIAERADTHPPTHADVHRTSYIVHPPYSAVQCDTLHYITLQSKLHTYSDALRTPYSDARPSDRIGSGGMGWDGMGCHGGMVGWDSFVRIVASVGTRIRT